MPINAGLAPTPTLELAYLPRGTSQLQRWSWGWGWRDGDGDGQPQRCGWAARRSCSDRAARCRSRPKTPAKNALGVRGRSNAAAAAVGGGCGSVVAQVAAIAAPARAGAVDVGAGA